MDERCGVLVTMRGRCELSALKEARDRAAHRMSSGDSELRLIAAYGDMISSSPPKNDDAPSEGESAWLDELNERRDCPSGGEEGVGASYGKVEAPTRPAAHRMSSGDSELRLIAAYGDMISSSPPKNDDAMSP
jgi:cytochrome c-type biogenesis protein CcmH/NrfF